jgi:uncharacterized protein (DUF2062 family)
MAAPGNRSRLRRWRARGRRLLRDRILGLDDTPHRIAWGVFLGFVIGATPTLGFQIMLYVMTAWVLRANKVAGIPPIMISNPITAVPLYYGTWWVGNLVLTGGGDAGGGRAAIQRMIDATAELGSFWEGVLSAAYWRTLGHALWDLGLELWIGGVICGAICGAICYPIAYRSVVLYRRRQADRRAERSARLRARLAEVGETSPP